MILGYLGEPSGHKILKRKRQKQEMVERGRTSRVADFKDRDEIDHKPRNSRCTEKPSQECGLEFSSVKLISDF